MKQMITGAVLLGLLLSVGIYSGLTSAGVTLSQIDPTQKVLTVEAVGSRTPVPYATRAGTSSAQSAFETVLTGTVAPDDDSAQEGIISERLEDGGFIFGDPFAPITIVLFADALCPHCQAYQPVVDQIIEELVTPGRARLELRYLPTQTLSIYIAQLLECVDTLSDDTFLSAYRETVNIAIDEGVTEEVSADLAEIFDIDEEDLVFCTLDAEQVGIDQLFAAQVGISGTPAIRIRYGLSDPRPINEEYSRGPVPFDVIEEAVNGAQLESAFVTTATP